MKKPIAILGTNEYQNPLIIRAKELGYETHVFGWKTGAIGETTADFYHDIDIMDYERLWKKCQEVRICGATTIASELAMHSMNYILRRLNIPVNSLNTEILSTNKYLMRCAMRDAGISGPRFILVDDDFCTEMIKDFTLPLIVKPIDLSSSRGVMKIESSNEMVHAIQYARSWSDEKRVIIEEFIDGDEYSGESITYNGEHHLLVVTKKQTTGAPHFVERGHLQPATLSEEMLGKIRITLFRAFDALGIKYGAIHPEFRITKNGEIRFMEIATRMGGDCIGSDLVPISTGYDYMGMVISIGCGQAPDFTQTSKPKKAEIRYILDETDLIEFERIKRDEPEILYRYSGIMEVPNKPVLKSADRAGYFITAK